MLNVHDYYKDIGVRETCHDVKQTKNINSRNTAIRRIANWLERGLIASEDTILVPAPQHTGKAEYTLDIAEGISKKTGAPVADIIKCEPHECLYDLKYQGENPEIKVFLTELPDPEKTYLFVDNVLSTGTTYLSCRLLFPGNLIPFVYAADYTRLCAGMFNGMSHGPVHVGCDERGKLVIFRSNGLTE